MDKIITLGICGFISIILPFILVLFFYIAGLCFNKIPWEGQLLDERFKKKVEPGIKFAGGTALSLVGIGKGSQLLDTSLETTIILSCLALICFFSFYMARIGEKGFPFRVFVFTGVCTSLSIMGISSIHFVAPSRFSYFIVFSAVVFPISMLCWSLGGPTLKKKENCSSANAAVNVPEQAGKQTSYMGRFSSFLKKEQPEADVVKAVEPAPSTSHRDMLLKLCDDFVGISTTTGIGIIAMGTWGDKLKTDPWMLGLLAISNSAAYWLLTGAQLLDRGVVFECCAGFGSVLAIAVANGAVLFLIAPGYEVCAFYSSFLQIWMWLKWDYYEKLLDKILKKKAE